MSETKRFTVAQVLTVMHDRMLCDMGGVYEILNWLTGDDLMTPPVAEGITGSLALVA